MNNTKINKMRKFIYTSIEKKDFGQTPKKELIYTHYNSLKYNETVEKLTKALNLADNQVKNSRSVKHFEFWSEQLDFVEEMLEKQYRLRKYDLEKEEKQIRNKMDNEVSQGKKFGMNYLQLQLELKKNIDKQDQNFHLLF